MVGFSCHDGRLNDYLNAAAQGGFLDIIMLRYTPFFTKGDAFDQAVDAAYKAGIAPGGDENHAQHPRHSQAPARI